jgi:alkylation response protein AidB-like acyl-CoA dehydrogenase
MTALHADPDHLLALAGDGDELDLAREALAFLDRHAERREPETLTWGEGDEGLTIFHETTGEQERREVDAAKAWQATRWANGFGWLTGPVAFGGRGLGASMDRLYRSIEDRYAVPDLSPLRIGLSTVGPSLVLNGTEQQVRRYAVGIQQGAVVACQLFSEPEAGSDLANVRTRAVRDGDDWILTGQKVWTSNAQLADIGLALVRTDPDAPKHKGLTMLLVPMDGPGVDVRPLRQLTGGASFTEVFLDDVAVPDLLRLGDEGAGWTVATKALAGERKAVGDRSHELTDRAIALLRELAVRTGAIDDPLIRDEWARVYASLRIARFQQQRTQALPDNLLSGAERGIDKLLVSTNLRDLGALAAQILGPDFVADGGEWGTYGWNKWMMGALGYRIAGGTEEILKSMLAERVLMLPREPK